MLRHGRAGVPMEVMGLMLGTCIDDYTIRVVDVFAMPQSGTGVSVEAVDDVFQHEMCDMLAHTGRYAFPTCYRLVSSVFRFRTNQPWCDYFRQEEVVGWYHSHPGFGCWLSSVDINTQSSFEQLTSRAVAVVVDPIQSVKGKVVIDAFRSIPHIAPGETRQTTSNVGHLNKPTIQALMHGLNRLYYSMAINYRKTTREQSMLMNLHKSVWTAPLEVENFAKTACDTDNVLKQMATLADGYDKRVKEEMELTKEQLATRYVGKIDPKKRQYYSTCEHHMKGF